MEYFIVGLVLGIVLGNLLGRYAVIAEYRMRQESREGAEQ